MRFGQAFVRIVLPAGLVIAILGVQIQTASSRLANSELVHKIMGPGSVYLYPTYFSGIMILLLLSAIMIALLSCMVGMFYVRPRWLPIALLPVCLYAWTFVGRWLYFMTSI